MSAALESAQMQSSDRYPYLPRAPIMEAVVDWRVKLPATLDISKLKQAGESLGPKYHFAHEERHFQFGIKNIAPGTEAELSTRELGTRGYRFHSEDDLEIAILSRDGFSFSRMKPYTKWETVFSEAERLWSVYRSVCQPEEVSRIAVRYINRILFPLPIDFGKYLAAPPAVPSGAPPVIASLLSRLVLQDPPTGILTNVTQVIEGVPEEGGLPFILDIDAYIVKSMQPDANEVTSRFSALREMKNRVFFATLTNAAIDMFR
jgi:uncharacterized protein (TIGR04255 family)